jgi:hypothetical protein
MKDFAPNRGRHWRRHGDGARAGSPAGRRRLHARQIAYARARIAAMGTDVSTMSDEDVQKIVAERERRFREEAPTTAEAAATIILDGVKAERWRILVGADAQRIDELVRRSPESAYDVDFFESFATEVGWRVQR